MADPVVYCTVLPQTADQPGGSNQVFLARTYCFLEHEAGGKARQHAARLFAEHEGAHVPAASLAMQLTGRIADVPAGSKLIWSAEADWRKRHQGAF